MLKQIFKFALPLFLLAFTACGLTEEEILRSITGEIDPPPEGTYNGLCIPDGSGSSSMRVLTLTLTSTSIQNLDFTGADDCSGTGTPDGAPEVTNIEFSRVDLTQNVSYFVEEETTFVPYVFQDNVLALGVGVTDISAGLTAVFEDFVSDPDANFDEAFTLVEE